MTDSYDLIYTEYFRVFILCKQFGFDNVEADVLANQHINTPAFLATLPDPTLASEAPTPAFTSVIDRLFGIAQ